MIDQAHSADRPVAHAGADRAAKIDLALSADGPAQPAVHAEGLALSADGPAQRAVPADVRAAQGQVEQAVRAGAAQAATPREIGGRQGPDPTRYGDWELRGRCIDF